MSLCCFYIGFFVYAIDLSQNFGRDKFLRIEKNLLTCVW